MDKKKEIVFNVDLLSVKPAVKQYVIDEFSSSDTGSAVIRFNVGDLLESDIADCIPRMIFYMRDGSIIQVADIKSQGTSFTYQLKHNELQHIGLANVEFILKLSDDSMYSSKQMLFKIVEGLNYKASTVAREIIIFDWESFTEYARDSLVKRDLDFMEYLSGRTVDFEKFKEQRTNDFVSSEADRNILFSESESGRTASFDDSQSQRGVDFESWKTDRVIDLNIAYTASEANRDSVYESRETGRDNLFDGIQTLRVGEFNQSQNSRELSFAKSQLDMDIMFAKSQADKDIVFAGYGTQMAEYDNTITTLFANSSVVLSMDEYTQLTQNDNVLPTIRYIVTNDTLEEFLGAPLT